MYKFIAHYTDMNTDTEFSKSIGIDTYCIDDNIPMETVWKWALDQAFTFIQGKDNMLFNSIELLMVC